MEANEIISKNALKEILSRRNFNPKSILLSLIKAV